MAGVLNISTDPSVISNNTNNTVEIQRDFGLTGDIIELYIIDGSGNIVYSENDFQDYSFSLPTPTKESSNLITTNVEPKIVNPEGIGAGNRDTKTPGPNGSTNGYWFNDGYELTWVTSHDISSDEGNRKNINIDPESILKSRGFTGGIYDIRLNFQRLKIIGSVDNAFTIKEISPTRRELRTIVSNISNLDFEASVSSFIDEISTSSFYKELNLNFGNNQNLTIVNLLLNKNTSKYELLVKLYQPLPNNLNIYDNFKLTETIIDSIVVKVELTSPTLQKTVINLRGPNFKIDVRQNNSVPSAFKNYDKILEYTSTSSYQHLLNRLENEETPYISYDYIRPVSESLDISDTPFHFENFVHFGSALERVKNFEYKLNLLEIYSNQVGDINSITGNTSSSFSILNNKESIETKKRNLIKGFDGYERFLYFESGTYSWPKETTKKPYELYSVTSSEALNWFGSEVDSNKFYGGQLLSASFFDNKNVYSLKHLIPSHIVENHNNDFYITFTHMIGHHFDQIWTHIKALTDINDADNVKGISKDLVYFTLKSLGLETFDQFENSNLIEYILGEGSSGSAFYNSPISQSMVTASNNGSIPKGDISKEIWKRLYHNAPYLLKTKGTERGIKALMSCYGVPSTMLNVKEYGGPVKDKTSYKTFSYDKSGLALTAETVSNSASGYFIKTNWSSSLTNALSSSAKTVEFRIKPKRTTVDYHLFSLSGSYKGVNHPSQSSYLDTHLVLNRYIGNDISSSGDSTDYGKLQLYVGDTPSGSTAYFPIFNGDFWNIHIAAERSTNTVHFGAYQSNHLKNVSRYITSSTVGVAVESGSYYDTCWGYIDGSGSSQAYFGGIPANGNPSQSIVSPLGYSGSMQEIRYYFGERLNDNILTKHALEPFMYAGNSISSSYNNLVLRLPLGSNCIENSASYHPDYNNDYLGAFADDTNQLVPLNNDLGYVATSSLSNTSFVISNPNNQNANGTETYTLAGVHTLANANTYTSAYKSFKESSQGALNGNQFAVDNHISEKHIRFFSGTGSSGDITPGIGEFHSTSNNRIGTAFEGFGKRSVRLSPTVPTNQHTSSLGLQFDFFFHGGKNISSITLSSSKSPGFYNTIGARSPMEFDVSITYDGITYETIDTIRSSSLTSGNWPEDCPSTTNPTTPSNAQSGYNPTSNWEFIVNGTTNSNDPSLVSRTGMTYYYGSNNSTFLDTGKSLGLLKGIRFLFKETFENHPDGPNSFNLNSKLQIENISFSEFNTSTRTKSNITSNIEFEEVEEIHHLPTPDTIGISATSEKVRIDTGIIDDNILSTTKRSETSILDRQPLDYEDLGIFFSPTNEINEDIIYTLGSFRLDDYIGSPLVSTQTSSNYGDLKSLRELYFKKQERRFNYWDYIKLIQYTDHTLFKLIEQFVPMKANTKTGLLIEPHYLERNKFARQIPVIDDGQTMVTGSYTTINAELEPNSSYHLTSSSMGGGNVVTTNNLLFTTSSNGKRKEQGTNTTINVSGHILDEPQNAAQSPITPYSGSKPNGYISHKSNVLLGNATKGRLSNKFYRSLRGKSTSSISESFSFEFDDSLDSLKGWFGVRYEGSKLIGKKINEYNATSSVWQGDITYGLNPVVENKTTALYIANSVVGGGEDNQFATIQDHSYIGIQKILVINESDDTVKIIDKETEDFTDFHRFITTDLPTGGEFNIKIIDPSIQHNLETDYYVKMNKGWLLSTFKYNNYFNDNGLIPPGYTTSFQEHNNPLELFDNSLFATASGNTFSALSFETKRLSFQYGLKADDPGTFNPAGNILSPNVDFSPSYVSSSIIQNKFTKDYYSGSLSFPDVNTGAKGAFLSASRFITNDTLNYLRKNHKNTEVHLTLLKGTKDLAPGFNDERSIGTFEVDRSFTTLINNEDDGTTPGNFIGHDTPIYPIIQLKGGQSNIIYQPTITPHNQTNDMVVLADLNSQSRGTKLSFSRDTYLNGNESPTATAVGSYSGSFSYELSFLDKDHTIITNLNKEAELFDGIGQQGIVLIPKFLNNKIKKNIEYYLEKAGIINKTTQFKS